MLLLPQITFKHWNNPLLLDWLTSMSHFSPNLEDAVAPNAHKSCLRSRKRLKLCVQENDVHVCSLSSGDRKVRVAAPEEKMDLPQRCRSDALCLPLIQPPPLFCFCGHLWTLSSASNQRWKKSPKQLFFSVALSSLRYRNSFCGRNWTKVRSQFHSGGR